jgi:hypothetical protein
MSPKNLWGKLPDTETITTPTTILKEQAAELTEMTKAVLLGDVTVVQQYSKFELQLIIRVPLLDNYEYVVLYATHTLDLYPVTVSPGWDRYTAKSQVTCTNREEFESAVGTILSSDKMRQVLTSLVAQSRSM